MTSPPLATMLKKALKKLAFNIKTRLHESGKRQELLAVDHRVDMLRAGEGPPLVYLHSVAAETRWLPFHQQLSRRFEVIAPDLLKAQVAPTLQQQDALAGLGQHTGSHTAARARPDDDHIIVRHPRTSKPIIRQAAASRLPPLLGSP